MPWGYLVSVLPVAWCTWWAVVPLPPRRLLGRTRWRFSLLVNELPVVAGYWLVACTLLAFGEGDIGGLDADGAWATVGLAVVTALGLGVLVAWGLRAQPALEAALAHGLGAGWRGTVTPDLSERLRRRRPWAAILLAPFAMRRRGVRHVRDLPYADGGDQNLLDVYHQVARPAPRSSSTCTVAASSAAARIWSAGRCCTGWPARAGCA